MVRTCMEAEELITTTHGIEVHQVSAETRELSRSRQERKDIVGAVRALVQVPVGPNLASTNVTNQMVE